MKKFLIVIVLLFISSTSVARIYIPIDQPSDKKFPIAITDLRGNKGPAREISSIIRHDLFLSGYFLVIDTESFESFDRNDGITDKDINFSYWSSLEAQALVKGEVKKEKDNLTVEIRLYDPVLGQMLVGKKYEANEKELREIAHRFSDEIMETLTGVRGVFNTKIAYSAIINAKKGIKEIYIMDMDGERAHKVTSNNSINLSPTWSPDGSKLAFTSYIANNPDLYLIDINGKNLRKLFGGSGTTLTPAWSPDNSSIAIASSMKGDSDLYLMSPDGKITKTLIEGGGIEISPTWSPDGTEIIYASEKAGGLHLYKTSVFGGTPTRLTFVGYQNDSPAWSPMGDKVAFSGRDLGTFDIFIMNPDGSNIQRLTIASGSNEHPSWSPDGRWITFSSTRGGERAIYIMRSDGSNQIRVSPNMGQLPEWGPWLK